MTMGAPDSTPLSALMYRGLGGVLGYLMSKYFGMGPVGQVVTTLMGVGLGNAFNNQLNKPKMPTGWMEI
jgi:F0F1-type ATP synthase assembly protein I